MQAKCSHPYRPSVYLSVLDPSIWRAIRRSESLPLVCCLTKHQDGMQSATWRYDKGQRYSSSNIGSGLLKRVSQIRQWSFASGRKYTAVKGLEGKCTGCFCRNDWVVWGEKSEHSQLNLKYFRSEVFIRDVAHPTSIPILLPELRFLLGTASPRVSW